eukprot:TRINITY_DN20254_c0_g1_i1.p1 TRINITY_DN20254_c0_g1~~TRINITY_DN20254_c0_g1_i1.p1  ORF type:complete len:769 (+),score=122.17 TRINITY_DN20254_c0_g1_i1:49-2355(+)
MALEAEVALRTAWATGPEVFSYQLCLLASHDTGGVLRNHLLREGWGERMLQTTAKGPLARWAYILGMFCEVDVGGGFGRRLARSPEVVQTVFNGLTPANGKCPQWLCSLAYSCPPAIVIPATIGLIQSQLDMREQPRRDAIQTMIAVHGIDTVPGLMALNSILEGRKLKAVFTLQRFIRVFTAKRAALRAKREAEKRAKHSYISAQQEWSAIMIQSHIRKVLAKVRARRLHKALPFIVWIMGKETVPGLHVVSRALEETVTSTTEVDAPKSSEVTQEEESKDQPEPSTCLNLLTRMGSYPSLNVVAKALDNIDTDFLISEADTETFRGHLSTLDVALGKGGAWGISVWDLLTQLVLLSLQEPSLAIRVFDILARNTTALQKELTHAKGDPTFTEKHTNLVSLMLGFLKPVRCPPVVLTEVGTYCGLRCVRRQVVLQQGTPLHYYLVMKCVLSVCPAVLRGFPARCLYSLFSYPESLVHLWDVMREVDVAGILLSPLEMKEQGMLEMHHAQSAASVIKRAWGRGARKGKRGQLTPAESAPVQVSDLKSLEEEAMTVLGNISVQSMGTLECLAEQYEVLKDIVLYEAGGRLDIALEETYAAIAVVEHVETTWRARQATALDTQRAAIDTVRKACKQLVEEEREMRGMLFKSSMDFFKEASRYKKTFSVQMKYIFTHLFNEATVRRSIETSERSHRDLLMRYEVSCRLTPLQRARNIEQRAPKIRHLRYLEAARSRPPSTYSPPRSRSRSAGRRKPSLLPSISPHADRQFR